MYAVSIYVRPLCPFMIERDFETFAIEIFKIRFHIRIPRPRIMLNPYFQFIAEKWRILKAIVGFLKSICTRTNSQKNQFPLKSAIFSGTS